LAKINAGGAPGKGSGIKIKPPVLPGAADSDKAGNLLDEALVGTPAQPQKESKKNHEFFRLR
jgi:type VI secretion system secreted protein VgrG